MGKYDTLRNDNKKLSVNQYSFQLIAVDVHDLRMFLLGT